MAPANPISPLSAIAPQDRAALKDPLKGQDDVLIRHGLNELGVTGRSVRVMTRYRRYRRLDVRQCLGQIAQDDIVTGTFNRTEPHRVYRRLFGLSHATIANSLICA